MCGIIGIVSKKKFSVKDELLKRLKRLEYRGYDSAGFATDSGICQKKIGSIDKFAKSIISSASTIPASGYGNVTANAAIAHTRWATHGGITDKNAHPHFNESKDLFIVHNGIIENYLELRQMLQAKGHTFSSETDSEVIAHFIEENLKQKSKSTHNAMHDAIKDLISAVKGTYAIIILKKGSENLYAVKKDSPAVIGICNGMNIVSSDIFAFSDISDKAIFLEDFQYAELTASSYSIFDRTGKKLDVVPKKFIWEESGSSEKSYKHHMIKEIYEEPEAAKRLLLSLSTVQSANAGKMLMEIKKAHRVILVGSGTSFHAAMLGKYLFNATGLDAYAFVASDFTHELARSGDVIVAISQSGETMDLLFSLKQIAARPDRKNIRLISLVNVPHSSIERLSDISINICAGQEICVAATKSFVNQVIALMYLASKQGLKIPLDGISEQISEVISSSESPAKSLAAKIANKKSLYIIGRDAMYPSALEIALKIKEIAYIHAEGMLAAELKHGTLALIEKGVPVVSLIPSKQSHTVSSAKEVEARGADGIIISSAERQELSLKPYAYFRIPKSSEFQQALFAVIVGQVITYYTALKLKRPIDKPRNLAKAVTVL